jgi:hypothetical protein
MPSGRELQLCKQGKRFMQHRKGPDVDRSNGGVRVDPFRLEKRADWKLLVS